jgi:hypothetical protein
MDELAMLGGSQSWRFAGRPANDQRRRTVLDLPIAKPFEGSSIDRSIIGKWRGYRGHISRQFRNS